MIIDEMTSNDVSSKPRLLFVCVENAGRSQMAEALARSFLGGRAEIYSAGSRQGERINPSAIAVLQERHLSVAADAHPKGLTDVPQTAYDYVVTMGCGDACPHIPARHRLDWAIPDPKGQSIEFFREVRDTIARQVRGLVDDLERERRASVAPSRTGYREGA